MKLIMVGLDHTTAPVVIRERLAFNGSLLPDALKQLTSRQGDRRPILSEAVILSTCNRVEIYGVAREAHKEREVVRFLSEFHEIPEEQFAHCLLIHTGEAVSRHLGQTAAGLRSLVLGEAQIQGQVRTAAEEAQKVGTLGPGLDRLFRNAITSGKRVRHETTLGQGAASVSQAGVELARMRLGSLEGVSVALIGSGEVSELAAQNLLANGARNLMIVNRTLANAEKLAERYSARAYSFDNLHHVLSHADIVISSTAAPTTILHRDQIADALQAKREQCGDQQQEMLLIDLAVPRDIDEDVAEIPGVYLATVDDLREVISHTLELRNAVAAIAERIVEEEMEKFNAWLRSQDALPILSTMRQQAETLRSSEVERAMRRLNDLSPEQQSVIEAFSHALVNKLLHHPTLRVKSAAAQGEGQRYAMILRDLFDIETI